MEVPEVVEPHAVVDPSPVDDIERPDDGPVCGGSSNRAVERYEGREEPDDELPLQFHDDMPCVTWRPLPDRIEEILATEIRPSR